MSGDTIRVCVTGAAGQIAYSLLYQISSGELHESDPHGMPGLNVLLFTLRLRVRRQSGPGADPAGHPSHDGRAGGRCHGA